MTEEFEQISRDEVLDLLEGLVFDCKVFKLHVFSAFELIENSLPKNPEEIVKTQFFVLNNLDVYRDNFVEIFSKYEIDDNEIRRKILNTCATEYLMATLIQRIVLSYSGVRKRISDIQATSRKLRALLQDVDGENGIITVGLSMGEGEHTAFSERIFRLIDDLEYFENLQETFANSWAAEWLSYGKSGPKEKIALNYWIFGMAKFWTIHLGRRLTYSNNKLSGREKFLSFADDCFENIHQVYGDEVVRNAYEKLRSRGELDYLF